MLNYNAHIGRIVITHKSKDAFRDLMTFLHLCYYNLNTLCEVAIGQSVGLWAFFVTLNVASWPPSSCHIRLYLDERVDLEHILTGSDRTQGHVVIATSQSQDRNALRHTLLLLEMGP